MSAKIATGMATDDEQFRIRIHHIGGIGESGPVEALDRLGKVEWVIYDAQAESLSSVRPPENPHRLVNRAIGGTDASAKFYVTDWPSASSLLRPSPKAEKYTFIKDGDRAQIWGRHTKIVKSTEMQVNSLDTLAESGVIPRIDFLSVDAQGAELSILDGASSFLKDKVIGVLCEVEFAELYENQPLFCDIQSRLRKDRFRVCEIYNRQYSNAAPTSPDLRGKGFLTVGEALFLKDAAAWIGDDRNPRPEASTQDVIQCLKLAAAAVAFDQLDYAIDICRRLESMGLVSLDKLADESRVKYVRMLRDLSRVAESREGSPFSLELREDEASRTLPLRSAALMRAAFGVCRLALLAAASRFSGRIPGRGFGREYPRTSRVLYEYGFEQLAIKQAVRNAGIPYLTGSYHAQLLDIVMGFLFGA